jgi:hypothetical protein
VLNGLCNNNLIQSKEQLLFTESSKKAVEESKKANQIVMETATKL